MILFHFQSVYYIYIFRHLSIHCLIFSLHTLLFVRFLLVAFCLHISLCASAYPISSAEGTNGSEEGKRVDNVASNLILCPFFFSDDVTEITVRNITVENYKIWKGKKKENSDYCELKSIRARILKKKILTAKLRVTLWNSSHWNDGREERKKKETPMHPSVNTRFFQTGKK